MRLINWSYGLGVKLAIAGILLAITMVYIGLPTWAHLEFEDRMFWLGIGKNIFLSGIFCLWIAAIVSDLRPKNAG